MSDKKIVSLSLFSGIGGFEVGMARAGIKIKKYCVQRKTKYFLLISPNYLRVNFMMEKLTI